MLHDCGNFQTEQVVNDNQAIIINKSLLLIVVSDILEKVMSRKLEAFQLPWKISKVYGIVSRVET